MPKRPLYHQDGTAALSASPDSRPQPDTPTPLLGGLTPAQFMRRYWQKRPLLIRGAVPDVEPPLSRDALFALAASDDAESRLVSQVRGRWRLDHGPFDSDALPSIKRRDWTLLVQGVDLHDDRARALLDRFRFVPDARLDDLMISYATDGGGVGPHFDSYDVFLLQVKGKRRWRISAQRDLTLKPGLPLKVLQHFEPEQEWVLEPGDMLYLPPHIAHDGVAVGECMTCSIGFRAPSANELIGQFLYYLAERGDVARSEAGARLYRDPHQEAVAHPAALPPALIAELGAILARVRWTERDLTSFLGSYLSEPKSHVVFDAPERPLAEAAFSRRAQLEGVRLDNKTALLYGARTYFVNGEEATLPRRRKWLLELADARRIEGKRFVTLLPDPSMTALLHEWYRAGWVRVGALL
ncbi:cupin domain-containing protein [Trinickia soli]|uniref:Cupin n=1 Tax=Trinickia soli TaxID=380675 RepID=A0A2N7VQ21_9BURK|nr:cupin domain-containing protein [Trinickia soli]KAA0091023.1 cupin domain-containing protein [Paraburkholderia sp. T12-10]PMS19227.1 cupin [Trinickia soli]CAB3643690.1 50S ribosomal protein L16 3-hydroxylase [Trinickia soli]